MYYQNKYLFYIILLIMKSKINQHNFFISLKVKLFNINSFQVFNIDSIKHITKIKLILKF